MAPCGVGLESYLAELFASCKNQFSMDFCQSSMNKYKRNKQMSPMTIPMQ